jgi:hypothetical protein
MDDGVLWANREGQWRAIAEYPYSGMTAVAADSQVRPVAAIGGMLLFGQGRDLEAARFTDVGVVQRIALLGPRLAVLGEGSRLGLYENGRAIRQGPAPAFEWHNVPLKAKGFVGIRDIAFRDDGVLVGVGDGGLAVSLTGTDLKVQELPASVRQDTLLRVVQGERGGLSALGKHAVIRFDPGAGQWVLDRRLAGIYGSPWSERRIGGDVFGSRDMAALPGGKLVIAVTGHTGVFDSVSDSLPAIELSAHENLTPRLHVLRDGRLIAAYGVRGDPALGGWLQVWKPPIERNQWARVELSRRMDVYDLADDGEYLYVAGSGWAVLKIPLDSLPFVSYPRPSAQ